MTDPLQPIADGATTPAGDRTLRAGRLADDYKALGVAVSLMMADPSFGRLPFGHWARILAGQIRRKHYLIATEGRDVTGFLGWALTDEADAERWLAKKGEISFEQSVGGDCLLINAWIARSDRTNRFLLEQLRVIGQGQRLVFAKRFYKDGRVRPVRLAVNEAVAHHIARRR